MRKILPLFMIFCLLVFAALAYANKIVQWDEAQKYYGQHVTVTGKIVATYNSGKACFLNFHPDYKRHFTAVIFRSAFDRFPANPEDYYYGKEVHVTGKIKEYKGKPEIILNDPSQIKIIGERQSAENASQIISWKEAHNHYGEFCTIEGTVVATYNSGKACFLNFHKNWKKYFTAVIFASNYKKFEIAPEDYYKNRKIRVSGLVKEYKGKPEIVVTSPAQIKLVN